MTDFAYKNKSWLYQKYIIKKLSTTQIGKLCAVSGKTILYWLQKYNIPSRTKSEALSGELNPSFGKPVSLETRRKISEAGKGKTHTEETKEKIRQALLGRLKIKKHKEKLSAIAKKRFKDKKNHPMYGKKNSWGTHTKKAKQKISKRMQGPNNPMWGRTGNKNPMWGLKGKNHPAWVEPSKRKSTLYTQIRASKNGIEWRKKIYQRDNYTCQFCGDNNGGNLNADHIKPLAVIVYENNITTLDKAKKCKELWDIKNGRTLCIKCHKSTKTYAKQINSLLEIASLKRI